MRRIDEIIVHCTATPEGRPISVSQVDKWHRDRGWDGIGYHWLVYLDGSIHQGRPEERIGAHCVMHNAYSIGVCYVGGLDRYGNPKDTRTPAQKASLVKLLKELKARYPNATIHGHNEYAAKACPCFKANVEYIDL